jgi:hypothetical protein
MWIPQLSTAKGTERGNRPLHGSNREGGASRENGYGGDAGAVAGAGNEVRCASSIGLQERRIPGVLGWDDLRDGGVVEGPSGVVDESSIFVDELHRARIAYGKGCLVGRDEQRLGHSILDTVAGSLTHGDDDGCGTWRKTSGRFGDDAGITPGRYSGGDAVESDYALALRAAKIRASDGDGGADSARGGQDRGNCRWRRRLRVS